MSYSDVVGQGSMALDQTRNAAYAAAIRRQVRPDSVVLDLGAGLGVLGFIAAAAGARKVYLVEPEAVVQGAAEVAKRNGFGDRVVVIQGRIEDIELPEQVDIITSVFTGNLLYSEDLLPSLFHARDRWLKPGGHLIPDCGELVVAPVSAPRLHEDAIGRWSQPHLGIAFDALRRFAANTMYSERRAGFQPELLGEPQVIASSDFMRATGTDCDATVDLEISADAMCSGVLAWIRIRLGDEWLGTGPSDLSVHWTPQLMLVDPELAVRAGEALKCHLHRPAHGEWTWWLSGEAGRRQQSTFLAQALSNKALKKLAPNHAATLNERGRIAQDLLGRMNGNMANSQLAAYLCATYSSQFAGEAAALAFVREFSRKYSA